MRRTPMFVTFVCLAFCSASFSTNVISQDAMFSDPATGQCELAIAGDSNVGWDGPYGRGYDVFDEMITYETIQIEVQHSGGPCSFVLTATPVSSGGRAVLANGAAQLEYDALRETNGPSILSGSLEGTPSTRIQGAFGAGDSMAAALLSVYIPPLQFVESGTFDGQFILRLYREDGASLELADERPITIIASVAARLRIEAPDFANGSTTTLIDLGELSAGARKEVDFEVRSNSRVNVALSSANRGALVHEVAQISIPYQVSGGGQLADLTGTARTRVGSSFAGQAFPLEIDVPPGAYPAGQYSDVLTVVFTTE